MSNRDMEGYGFTSVFAGFAAGMLVVQLACLFVDKVLHYEGFTAMLMVLPTILIAPVVAGRVERKIAEWLSR